jgi:hypothetical protein
MNTNEHKLGKSNVGLNSFVIFGLLIPQTSYCTHELHYTIQIVVILKKYIPLEETEQRAVTVTQTLYAERHDSRGHDESSRLM